MSSYLVAVANSKDGSISTFELTDGLLGPIAHSEIGRPGMPLASDSARGLVFAGSSDEPGVSVLGLDRATGQFSVQGWYPAHGAPTYLTLSSDGSLLLSASYHAGVGELWRVGADGTLTSAGEPVHYRNMHSVQASADGRFAYFVGLRDDLIAQYGLAADGSLSPLAEPTVAAPAGSGPRHLILDADQTSAYVITEYSGEVLHYRRDPDNGQLTFVSATSTIADDSQLQHSRFGADPRSEGLIWSSDLHLDEAGRRLYCAERNDATITALDIDVDGAVGEPTAYSTVVPQPRGFAVLPGGDLLVASEIDRQVGLYRPDDAGSLVERVAYPVGLGANWVEVIAR